MMISEEWNGRDVEENGRSLIYSIIPNTKVLLVYTTTSSDGNAYKNGEPDNPKGHNQIVTVWHQMFSYNGSCIYNNWSLYDNI
jgi:hypothetical protein